MWEYVALFVAGIAAGAVGYLMGLASLVSYPAMLAVGIPPVLANTSNTVALLGSGLGSVTGARKIIRDVKVYPLWPQLLFSVVGGIAGGQLLLHLDQKIFESVVPWFVLGSTALVLASPMIRRLDADRTMPIWAFLLGLLAITTYAGYFGAGAGIPFFALCLLGTPMTVHQALAIKTPMILMANLSAAVLFILQGSVVWWAALTLGAGSFMGGYIGPVVQQYIPEKTLRWLVGIGGAVLTVWLLVR